MLRQYRHAVAKTLWEIPAGTLENGENPLACAQRELIEETGYSAGRWNTLGATTPVPGYSSERIHLFLARDISAAEQDLDVDEIITVEKVPFDQVVDMIADGAVEDTKTIAAVFLAMQKFGDSI
jgi:ADP-ribose pyrophosphatase